MTINFETRVETLDQNGLERYLGKPRRFRAINREYFDSFRVPRNPGMQVSPFAGVTIDWPEDGGLPWVTLEDFRVNEDAQFFLQTHADILVEYFED